MLFNLVWGLTSQPETMETTPPEVISKTMEVLKGKDVFVSSKRTDRGVIYKIGGKNGVFAIAYSEAYAFMVAKQSLELHG